MIIDTVVVFDVSYDSRIEVHFLQLCDASRVDFRINVFHCGFNGSSGIIFSDKIIFVFFYMVSNVSSYTLVSCHWRIIILIIIILSIFGSAIRFL